jgi:hypothetical protein
VCSCVGGLNHETDGRVEGVSPLRDAGAAQQSGGETLREKSKGEKWGDLFEFGLGAHTQVGVGG